MFSLESDSKHEGATQTQTEWPKPALGKFSNFSFFLKGKEKKEDKKNVWIFCIHTRFLLREQLTTLIRLTSLIRLIEIGFIARIPYRGAKP